MSLEEALAANTAAIKEQTAFLKSLQGKAPAGNGAAAATTAPKATATKPKAKAITIDTIKERFGAYLGIEDKTERKARIEKVQAFAEHFGVSKMSELAEENWAEAIAGLDALEAGNTPDFMNEEGAGGGDDSLV